MNRVQLQPLVEQALALLRQQDAHLFEQNLSERCLTARLALHLQPLLPDWSVDVEYNRDGDERVPKQLGLDERCANRRGLDGRAYVTPDLIVHRRGRSQPAGGRTQEVEQSGATRLRSRACGGVSPAVRVPARRHHRTGDPARSTACGDGPLVRRLRAVRHPRRSRARCVRPAGCSVALQRRALAAVDCAGIGPSVEVQGE